WLLALLLAPSAAHAADAPPQSVAALKDQIIEAVSPSERGALFEALAKTPPTTGRDVGALFDLFLRFSEEPARRAVLESVSLMPQSSAQLEPLFISYLKQPDPEAQFFGINGAFRLRSS